jgi:hypothetical protein
MTDEHEVVERLRALASEPIPSEVRARHLAMLADDPPLVAAHATRSRRHRARLVGSIAAACLLVAGMTWLASRPEPPPDPDRVTVTDDGTTADAEPDPGDTRPEPDRSGGEPADPRPDDPCSGPPPFAGQDPTPPPASDPAGEEGAGRQAESDDWEEAKAECPTDDTRSGDEPTGRPGDATGPG